MDTYTKVILGATAVAAACDVLAGFLPDKYVKYIGGIRRLANSVAGKTAKLQIDSPEVEDTKKGQCSVANCKCHNVE